MGCRDTDNWNYNAYRSIEKVDRLRLIFLRQESIKKYFHTAYQNVFNPMTICTYE